MSGDDGNVPGTAGQLGASGGGTGCRGCGFHQMTPFRLLPVSGSACPITYAVACRPCPLATRPSRPTASARGPGLLRRKTPACGDPAPTRLPPLPTGERPELSGRPCLASVIRTAPEAACLSGSLCRAPAELSAAFSEPANAAVAAAGLAPPRSTPEQRPRRAGPL